MDDERIETKIATTLIKRAFARDWKVSVNDGGETVLTQSADFEDIFGAMRSTDEDILSFHDGKGVYQGWVLLIWGNGCDLISDCSGGAAIDELIDEVAPA